MSSPLLAVNRLSKHFQIKDGVVHALDDVSFEIAKGETLALVGESGCGKSTLGKTLMRLYEPSSGEIRLQGQDISQLSRREMRPFRRDMQKIFQDPYSSLNPRATVGRILEEPLIIHGVGDAAARKQRVAWLMDRVGLRPELGSRLPHEFSGGQRQRIGIARALALQPQLIICDEPVSALDVSVRAQVINLLADLKREFSLSYLFISHDLSVVRHVADRIVVMYLGRVVEVGDRRSLWVQPLHPYTRALLAAAPQPNPEAARNRKRYLLQGDIPSPLNPPSGCRFRTRCPHATELCAQKVPELRHFAPGQQVACHHAEQLSASS
jgi:oligopeptide transport system ATP-binding protein